MIFDPLPESYAKALLDLTRGKEKETLEYLKDIRKVLEEDPQIKHFFLNPAVTKTSKVEVIRKIFQDILPKDFLNFLCVLAKNNRIGLLSEIEKIYHYYYDEQQGIIPVKVITAIELELSMKEQIKQVLDRYFKKNTDPDFIVQPQIIGGIIIQSQGYEIDNSVITRLRLLFKNLKNTMITGEAYED